MELDAASLVVSLSAFSRFHIAFIRMAKRVEIIEAKCRVLYVCPKSAGRAGAFVWQLWRVRGVSHLLKWKLVLLLLLWSGQTLNAQIIDWSESDTYLAAAAVADLSRPLSH